MKMKLNGRQNVSKLLGAVVLAGLVLTGCADSSAGEARGQQPAADVGSYQKRADETKQGDVEKVEKVKIKATVNGKEFFGTLENNATTKAMLERGIFPMTLDMTNAYSREMLYRYGEGTFPVEQTRSDHFEVGDIIYWPPRGSFVILYRQDGDTFERQQVGHIDGDFSIFENGQDATVTFEIVP